jgi:hypothetical protein
MSRRSARAMRAWRVRVLAQSRRYWSSRLSPTASVWRILLHAIRSLWAGTNAAPWGALLDTISSGIGSGSGRSVAKCPGGISALEKIRRRASSRTCSADKTAVTNGGCGAVWIIIQVMPGCGLGHKLAYALVESASDIPSRPSSPNRTSA